MSNVTTWQKSEPVSVHSVTKYYTFSDQQVAMREGDEVYYLHGDHLDSTSLTTDQNGNVVAETRYLLSDGLGSVRQAVDETGAVVAYHEFDPYGNSVDNIGGNPYGYTGEWYEGYIELLHLRARWYLPGTGTFLSVDPVESEPPYQYVGGNPVNWVDSLGTTPSPNNNCQTGKCEVTGYHFDYQHIHLGHFSDLPEDVYTDWSNWATEYPVTYKKFVSPTFEGNNMEQQCYVVQYMRGSTQSIGADWWLGGSGTFLDRTTET